MIDGYDICFDCIYYFFCSQDCREYCDNCDKWHCTRCVNGSHNYAKCLIKLTKEEAVKKWSKELSKE